MIDLEKLKPILAEVLNESNSADVIERVTALDETIDDRQTEIDTLTRERDEAIAQKDTAVAERDKYWNLKIKDMFLKGDGTETNETQTEKDPYEKYTFENLMYGG